MRVAAMVGTARRVALVVLWAAGIARGAAGQELSLSARAPRFLAVSPSEAAPVEIGIGSSALLRRVVSLNVERPTVGRLLETIEQQTGIRFGYSGDIVPVSRVVALRADTITVGAALLSILMDTGVDVVLSSGGKVALVRRGAGDGATRTGAIVGRVRDAATGEPVAGADVFLERTRARASTGENGVYRLADVEAGNYTLAVRRLGYGKQSRAVTVVDGQEVTVDIVLQPVATQLDEIVTTVTGEQRLRELGHVVGRINADSLVKEAPVSSVTELLTARIPGLLVQPRQGTVGGEVSLQIRSANSRLLSTEPIVIVDGIRYTTTPRGGPNPNYGLGPFDAEGTSRLNDLNPNDIESIEVVKGPSAATLYGTDAANGVIVITTKRGRSGPAQWSAYARSDLRAIPQVRYPDTWWGWSDEFGVFASCTLAYAAQGACAQDSITVLPNPLNDPAYSILGSAPSWEYGASVAGGSPDLRYYFSAARTDATGPVQFPPALIDSIQTRRGVSELPKELLEPNTQTDLNLQSAVTVNLSPRAELRVNAGYTQGATRTLALGSAGAYSGTASRRPGAPYGGETAPDQAFARTSTERVNRFSGSTALAWRPWTWLQARGTVGLDLVSGNRYSLARPGESSTYATGAAGDDRTRQINSSADLGLTASGRLGRLSSRTSLGAQYVRTLLDALTSTGYDLPPGGSSVNDAAFRGVNQIYSERVTLGSYVEQVFGLNDRLFLTGALRMDGGSGFGQAYNVAAYPKASLSWLLSEEPFLPRVPGLDELRLRYAFGASGQQPWSSMTLARFGSDQRFVDGTVGSAAGLILLGNPDLRPERVREHEFGLDAAALGGRLRLDLTWNYRRTLDALTNVDLPPGFGYITTNLGRIDGHGFEARLTLRPLETRLVSWDVTMQHAWHDNVLIDLAGEVPFLYPNGGYAEGYPLGARFTVPFLGYADANGDGIIVASEVELGGTAVYVGRSVVPRTQTLSTTLGLFQQRLRISTLLDRQSGHVVYDERWQSQCGSGRCQAAVDPSTPLAEQAKAAAWSQTASNLMEPATFTRLREITVALDVPAGLLRALRLQRASLSVAARNLAQWTSFSGPDPESPTHDRIPQARDWTFRFDVGF